MNKRIEKQINKIYEEVFKKVFTPNRLKRVVSGNTSDVSVAVHNLEKSREYKKFCQEFAKRLAMEGLNKEKGLWKKYYEAAKKNKIGVLPATYSQFELQQLNKAIHHNFKMIKSIPNKIFEVFKEEGVKQLLKQTATGSVGRGTFQRFLQERGAKNAKVIARTETAKLQTAILENRSTELGSVCYMWASTKDKRTRPSHKRMNGVIVFWRNKDSEKPLLDKMNGNPGEMPNCRCSPEPIFDEKDLVKSNYEVYNYKTHNIINMTKRELLKAINKGGL